MPEIYAEPMSILSKEPEEDDDRDASLPETEPYEQQGDDPSQNGQDPSSSFGHEIGDPLGLPLTEAILTSRRLVGGSAFALVRISRAVGPEENGDETGRPLGREEDEEELDPDFPGRERGN